MQNKLNLSEEGKQDDSQKALVNALVKLEKDRKVFGEKSVRIPEVKWSDVGGLASAKEDII